MQMGIIRVRVELYKQLFVHHTNQPGPLWKFSNSWQISYTVFADQIFFQILSSKHYEIENLSIPFTYDSAVELMPDGKKKISRVAAVSVRTVVQLCSCGVYRSH